MARSQPPSPASRAAHQPTTPDSRLVGWRLSAARVLGVCGVVFGVGNFVARVPGHFADLQGICTRQVCPYGQLDPSAAAAAQSIGISLGAYAVLRVSLTVAVAMIWFGVAAVLMLRRSDEWMALLVAAWLTWDGAATITGALALGYTHSVQFHQHSAQLINFLARFGFFLVFALFPTGRFVPRWSFWLVLAFAAEELPFEFLGRVPLSGWLPSSIWILTLAALAATQVYRYRNASTPLQRQQTKWAVFGISLFIMLAGALLVPYLFNPALGYPGSLFNTFHTTVLIAFGALTPLAIGLAILRYRLWEIDTLINRALVYGLLTATLAALYAGLVIGLESLTAAITGQSGQQPGAIVVSTLAIAALAQPLRRRLQTVIDQRFYRRKYDAAKMLAAFSATLRTETDLGALSEKLIAVIGETTQPAHVSLWLRPTGRRPAPARVERVANGPAR
jgi:hypothetical protein